MAKGKLARKMISFNNQPNHSVKYVHIYQKEVIIPKWLPQYEHLNNVTYNKNKNHELMKFLNDEVNKHKTWQELPERIKKDFGNNPNYYKGYLKHVNALL